MAKEPQVELRGSQQESGNLLECSTLVIVVDLNFEIIVNFLGF